MVATFPTASCGRGWVGVRKGRCQRAKPDHSKQHGIGKTIAHQGVHLAENVAAWKTGKVVGGAITALAASKGYDGDSIRIMAETAVQATAATLLSMRDKSKRTPEAIATKFVAESLAGLAGKLVHGGFEDAAESFGKSEHFASIGALLSGKGAGITTNVTAMRSGLAATVAKAVLRKRVDSFDVAEFGLSSDQILDLLVGAMVMLMREGLREDAYINKGLGTSKCGRGWVGIRGNCRRSTARKYGTGKNRQQSKNLVSGKSGIKSNQKVKAKAVAMADRIRAELGKPSVSRKAMLGNQPASTWGDGRTRQTEQLARNTGAAKAPNAKIAAGRTSRQERNRRKEENSAIVMMGGRQAMETEREERGTEKEAIRKGNELNKARKRAVDREVGLAASYNQPMQNTTRPTAESITNKLKAKERQMKQSLYEMATPPAPDRGSRWKAFSGQDQNEVDALQGKIKTNIDLQDRANKQYKYKPEDLPPRHQAVTAYKQKQARKSQIKDQEAAKKEAQKAQRKGWRINKEYQEQDPKRIKAMGIAGVLLDVEDKTVQTNLRRRLEEAQRQGPLTEKRLDRVFSAVGGSSAVKESVTKKLRELGVVKSENNTESHKAELINAYNSKTGLKAVGDVLDKMRESGMNQNEIQTVKDEVARIRRKERLAAQPQNTKVPAYPGLFASKSAGNAARAVGKNGKRGRSIE